MAEMVATEIERRVAVAISGAPFPSAASLRKARAAIAAYEAFQAKDRSKKAAANNIAYLQANIAQCETFMARGKEADPIGHMQWGHRWDEFQRELDAALAAVDEPDAA